MWLGRLAWVAGILAVYAWSFTLPAWDEYDGREAFLAAARWQFGRRDEVALDLTWLGWSPNALLWLGLGCLLTRRDVVAMFLGLAATGAACAWMPLAGLQIGYYLWLLSMTGLAMAGVCCGTARPDDDTV